MREQYYPPKFKEQQFHCIHCDVFASQRWFFVDMDFRDGYGTNSTGMEISVCQHCDKQTYWYQGKMVVPAQAPVEPPHPDLPDDCRLDYLEASAIFSQSPRAAAALLRLCIQKLMPHIGGKGKNINDDIKALVAQGLPVLVQRALDYCRVVGNNAVHPGEIDIQDTPEIAQNLFRMINFIVEDRITRPKEIETLYNLLPEDSRNAIEKRDQGNNTTQP